MKNELLIGEPISLRHPFFEEVIDEADEKLDMALRRCLASGDQERFDLTIKITFSAGNGKAEPIIHETGYKFEPSGYKVKQEISEPMIIMLDYKGRPIFPDQPTQMHMTDLEAGDE